MYWSVQENLDRLGKALYPTVPTGSASNFPDDSSNSSSEDEEDNNDKHGHYSIGMDLSGASIGMDLSARESIVEGLIGLYVPSSSKTSALMGSNANNNDNDNGVTTTTTT